MEIQLKVISSETSICTFTCTCIYLQRYLQFPPSWNGHSFCHDFTPGRLIYILVALDELLLFVPNLQYWRIRKTYMI